MNIETLDRRNISESDARAVAELLCLVWPKPGRTVETRIADTFGRWKDYRGPETEFPRSLIIREGEKVIAHAGALPRTIGTSSGEMTIMALAGVCTDPAARGRHLGQAVARAAFDTVDHGPFPFSLFQTSRKVAPFYEQLGAVAVANRFVNSLADDPNANPFWDEVVMVYPAAKPWPQGVIDLRGPGF